MLLQDYKASKRQKVRSKIAQQLKTSMLRRGDASKDTMLSFLGDFAGDPKETDFLYAALAFSFFIIHHSSLFSLLLCHSYFPPPLVSCIVMEPATDRGTSRFLNLEAVLHKKEVVDAAAPKAATEEELQALREAEVRLAEDSLMLMFCRVKCATQS